MNERIHKLIEELRKEVRSYYDSDGEYFNGKSDQAEYVISELEEILQAGERTCLEDSENFTLTPAK